jgi:hypothetical protein
MPSDRQGDVSAHRVKARRVKANRDAYVANIIYVNQPGEPEPRPEPVGPPPRLEADPRPEVTRAALAFLEQADTCIYLGHRYGLTPQSPVPPGLFSTSWGARPPAAESLSAAMSWLEMRIGMEAACRHLADHFGSLDKVDPEVGAELKQLAAVAPGRTFVTGCYTARLQNALGPSITIVQRDEQIGRGLMHRSATRAHLLMLHGSEQDFQNALVARDDVLTYSEHRPALAKAVSDLLSFSWIVLGADEKADGTFHLLVGNVCRHLGMRQRPIYVVDPRPEHEVDNEWPKAALRHVRLAPAEFLSQVRPAE